MDIYGFFMYKYHPEIVGGSHVKCKDLKKILDGIHCNRAEISSLFCYSSETAAWCVSRKKNIHSEVFGGFFSAPGFSVAAP
jgi:hypothetical protein